MALRTPNQLAVPVRGGRHCHLPKNGVRSFQKPLEIHYLRKRPQTVWGSGRTMYENVDDDGDDDDGVGGGDDDDGDENVADDDVEDDNVAEDEVEGYVARMMLRKMRWRRMMLRKEVEDDDVEDDDDVKGEEEDDVENDDIEEEEDDTEDADAEEDHRSQDRAACFARACAVEMHLDISQELLCEPKIHLRVKKFSYRLIQTPARLPQLYLRSNLAPRRQSGKKTIFKHLLKELLKGKSSTFRPLLQYDLRFSAAKQQSKHTSTASTKKRKSHLEPAVTLRARANRTGIDGKVATPAPVAQASQLFSTTEPLFTQKTHCFVQILTFKSHP